MDELKINKNSEGTAVSVKELTTENRLEIIGEGLRKKYLSRLTEMQIAPVGKLLPLEEDLIDNVRMYHITEMVYGKGESVTDKFTTVFNTLSTYNATVFIILDSDGRKSRFYIGVRNNETDPTKKRSTVTLGDTLKNALIGENCHAAVEMIESLTDLEYSIIVYKTPEKRDVSAILIAELMGDEIIVKYLANISGNPKDFAFILELFRNMIISKNMSSKTLVFCTADQNTESIISKLAGKELIPAGNMMVGYKAIEV